MPRDLQPYATNVDDFVSRAYASRDTGLYGLGHGPTIPDALTPLDEHGRCDCSRYLFWLWRLSPVLPVGLLAAGYREPNTTAIASDAQGAQAAFVEVRPGGEVKPGDGIVYGGKTVFGVRVKIGHCGGVVGVLPGFRYVNTLSLAQLRVSHCNAGVPPAIDETNGRIFAAHGAIIVRPRWRW